MNYRKSQRSDGYEPPRDPEYAINEELPEEEQRCAHCLAPKRAHAPKARHKWAPGLKGKVIKP